MNHVKQSCRQLEKYSDKAGLRSLCPEALQAPYKVYGLLLEMAILYYLAERWRRSGRPTTTGERTLLHPSSKAAKIMIWETTGGSNSLWLLKKSSQSLTKEKKVIGNSWPILTNCKSHLNNLIAF